MDELVFKGENNHALTNSLLVAEKFGKNHRDVIRSVKNLTAQNCAVSSMFIETTYLNERNQSQPMFIMDRDGFTLLVMGFTGKQALNFKIDYIKAFNNMEAILHSDTYGFALRMDNVEKKVLALESENTEIRRRNLILTIKETYFDHLISSENTYTTSYIAHELGTSGRKLNELLNKFGIIYKHNDRWMLYSHYVDKGYHKALTNIEVSPGAKVSIAVYVAWTEKGRIFIHSTINKKLILYPGLLDSKK